MNNSDMKPMNSDNIDNPRKEFIGEHGPPEDRSSTEGTANFINRRKDSATSAVT